MRIFSSFDRNNHFFLVVGGKRLVGVSSRERGQK